jgi:hypothetical protein
MRALRRAAGGASRTRSGPGSSLRGAHAARARAQRNGVRGLRARIPAGTHRPSRRALLAAAPWACRARAPRGAKEASSANETGGQSRRVRGSKPTFRNLIRQDPAPSTGGPELAPRASCLSLPCLPLLLPFEPRPRPCPQPSH